MAVISGFSLFLATKTPPFPDKRLFVADQQSVGATLQPVFLSGSWFFSSWNTTKWFQRRHWLQTSTWTTLVERGKVSMGWCWTTNRQASNLNVSRLPSVSVCLRVCVWVDEAEENCTALWKECYINAAFYRLDGSIEVHCMYSSQQSKWKSRSIKTDFGREKALVIFTVRWMPVSGFKVNIVDE